MLRPRMISYVYNYFSRHEPIRALSTNNLPQPEIVSSFDPRLQAIFKQLDGICPRFVLNQNDITILTDPKVFYQTLKDKILTAQDRIFLSSLYVGKKQHELVATLDTALTNNENLTVSILTDALRGTREAPQAPCSANLLVRLVEKFGHRVDIRMYHTPHLKGFTKSLTPKRINEAWGLQHMKLYGFDDEIILSGANLSEDYFTDRQDRYYVFHDKKLTNYYHLIHSTICSISYQINPSTKNPSGFNMDWPISNKSCEPHVNVGRFISDTSFLLEPLLKQQDLTNFEEYEDADHYDTIVYPISQFSPLLPPKNDISTEKPSILRLLTFLDSPKIKWWFTAGYFNMLPEIQQRLIDGMAGSGTIITASAKANSFYKSSGVSYYIPEAYLLIAKKFLQDIKTKSKENLIKLYEWQNGVVNTPGGWSYHAKGIWITAPDEEDPSITIIGSSNYTKRAYTLDLESNAIVITKDAGLKKRMSQEINNLLIHAKQMHLEDFDAKLVGYQKGEDGQDDLNKPIMQVDEDRRISYGVHLGLKVLGGKF